MLHFNEFKVFPFQRHDSATCRKRADGIHASSRADFLHHPHSLTDTIQNQENTIAKKWTVQVQSLGLALLTTDLASLNIQKIKY